MCLAHIWSQSACCWPAASVSVVSLLAGSPWRPPPDTGEDRVDGSDPLASESSLGCFFLIKDWLSFIPNNCSHPSCFRLQSHFAFHIKMNVIVIGTLPAVLDWHLPAESFKKNKIKIKKFCPAAVTQNHQVNVICAFHCLYKMSELNCTQNLCS